MAKKTTKTRPKPKPKPKPPERETIAGDGELAERYAVSRRTVNAWRNAGLPNTPNGRGFIYDVQECDAWVEAYRSNIDDEDEDGVSLNKQLKEQKLREATLRNDKLERDHGIAEGSLLDLTAYRQFSIEVITMLVDELRDIPAKIAKQVGPDARPVIYNKGGNKPAPLQREIADAIRRCKERLTEGPDGKADKPDE